jgi:hypothetical protein
MLALALGYGHLCELDFSLVNNIKFNHQFNDSTYFLGVTITRIFAV